MIFRDCRKVRVVVAVIMQMGKKNTRHKRIWMGPTVSAILNTVTTHCVSWKRLTGAGKASSLWETSPQEMKKLRSFASVFMTQTEQNTYR